MKNKKKLTMCLAVIFALNILLITFAEILPQASAATYRQGSSGSVVTQIQTRLKNWGYYTGSVDGVFGSRTTSAVKLFQSKNNLTVDGIVGPSTLAALGISDSSSSQSNDLYLLARLISAEARGEPYVGQVAVGAVVLNRVSHPSFPNTLSGVIYQNGAFSCIDDGQWHSAISDSAYRAAQDALNGWDPSGGAIYYYNPAKATSSWIFNRQIITTIGDHVFCL